MKNELAESEKQIVSLVGTHELGDIIKPLTQKIHLFDSFVAGTTHLKDPSVLDTIAVGDELSMQREDNQFDNKAIMILTRDKAKLGYVPEKDNIIFSRLMDAGKLLKAKIIDIHKRGNYTQIAISIYLVDF